MPSRRASTIVLALVIAALLVSCQRGEPVAISNFVSAGGRVDLGEPQLGKEGCWWITVDAQPEHLQSVKFVGDFDVTVDRNRIYLTARMFRSWPFQTVAKTRLAFLCDIEDGRYDVYYRDPSGKTHLIREIELDRQTELSYASEARPN